MKVEGCGWLFRDDCGGGHIMFSKCRPRPMDEEGMWHTGLQDYVMWTPRQFSRKYTCNFPFPAKGSLHHVEITL